MDGRYLAPTVRLSVVICTKDRPRELATCLASIARQRRLPMEVVVVDSSGTPPEAVVEEFRHAVANGCAVALIHTQPGLPRQRNVGIRAARGDVIVFFDDDVVLEPAYLEELALVYDRDVASTIGGVGGAQVPDPTPRESLARRAWSRVFLLAGYGSGRLKRSGHAEYAFCPTAECEVDFLSGCNMSFRREVFADVMFDERLSGYAIGEDLQFSYRVSRRWKLVLSPRARLDHRHAGGGRPRAGRLEEMRVINRFLFMHDVVARNGADWAAYAWAELGTLLQTLRHPGDGRLRGRLRGHLRVLAHVLTHAPLDERRPPAASPGLGATDRSLTVSVVVPARNEEGFIGRCLASVLAQDYPAERMEVIVVENGSVDRTAEVAAAHAARDPRVRIIRSDATNQAAAMNDGIVAAHGDVVARVDAHSWIPREYVSTAVAALRRHPHAAGVGGPFLPAGETLLERVSGMARASRLGVGGGYGVDRQIGDHAVATVQCGAYWRHTLVDVGLFDAAMAYGEDEEINWRLTQSGGRIYLCPALMQRYRPRPTLRALARQYWNYGQGRFRVVMKHPAFLVPRHVVPSAFVLSSVLLGCLAVVLPLARVALVALAAAYGAVLTLAALQAARAGWREALLVPPAIACVHFGYGAGMLWAAARRMGRSLGFPGRQEETREWQYVMDRPRR
jgi:glycosyltransferase involved in cell wall biosynthesis